MLPSEISQMKASQKAALYDMARGLPASEYSLRSIIYVLDTLTICVCFILFVS